MAIVITLLSLISSEQLEAQMASVVNSDADDEFALAYDFLVTPDFDESTDGICEDSLHRCTLRAALEEAGILNQPAFVTFSLDGIITIDDSQGPFSPPDGSRIVGDGTSVSIYGSGPFSVLFNMGNETRISGLKLSSALIGIVISGTDNQIGSRGSGGANTIHGMVQDGILITGDSNTVIGNIIGLDILGNPDPSQYGIFITGKQNYIGGTNAGEPNIISGNDIGVGVYAIDGDSLSKFNHIDGNLIGLDPTGSMAKQNRVGIEIIGPGTSISKNTISGNKESGILVGLDAEGISIVKNDIGLALDGISIIPNREGITLGPGSSFCEVDSNRIVGNLQAGIGITGHDGPGLESTQHVIKGNEISKNQAGIGISGNVTYTTIGSAFNTEFPPNWIHHNSSGVSFITILGSGIPGHNNIRKNIFNDHAGKAINIYTSCPTCQEQTFPPVITTYEEVDPVTAVITGTHHTAGSKIDIYIGDLNLAGQYEGGTWLGSATVNANFDFILTVDNCGCDIVATATSPMRSTSEFTDGKSITTSVEDPADRSNTKIYPNPFDENTTIEFELTKSENVALAIYDMAGRKIETLLEGRLHQGKHKKHWYASANPAGIYYYQLNTGNFINTGKLVYLK